ncbi:MAG: ATP--guanido phosphotransferase, partial [bacterium]|nr:ATP--guanido phosphotransferase [bacterium]
SNQVTLGVSEEDVFTNLRGVVEQIIFQEIGAVKALINKNVRAMEDKVYRALGILQNARVLPLDEAMNLISNLRMGAVADLVNVSVGKLTDMMVVIQPATLQKHFGEPFEANIANVKRAELIRAHLAS